MSRRPLIGSIAPSGLIIVTLSSVVCATSGFLVFVMAFGCLGRLVL